MKCSRTHSGSSPRVRGTRPVAPHRAHRRRFIPACAGNSPSRCRPRPAPTVHPRVCGELPGAWFSPPPVARFIPACAGNSCYGGISQHEQPVHPRVCGELAASSTSSFKTHGSSPRVRGTPRNRHDSLLRHRFIPACAGNSPGCARRRPPWSVHPRVCGELEPGAFRPFAVDGSSPRVRGTRYPGRRADRPRRFIPACAGNSLRCHPTGLGPTVHPRVCGELVADVALDFKVSGSSPRVRGTRGA